jgi:hypothetical protein
MAAALALAACAPASPAPRGGAGLLQPPPAPSRTLAPGLHTVMGPVPFPIEANVGQADPSVGYVLRAGEMHVGFGTGRVAYRVFGQDPAEAPVADPEGCGPRDRRASLAEAPEPCRHVRAYRVDVELVGATQAAPRGAEPAETTITYLVGATEHHRHGVPAFHHVRYADAWPGIDVAFERTARGVKSAYHVAPGADPAAIAFAYHAAEDVRIGEDGSLVVTTPLGELREAAPVAWQDGPDGAREPVDARWAARPVGAGGEATWGFDLGPYDPARPLVIDPDVTYATFLGGSSLDYATAIAVDGGGAAYVAGASSSTNFGFGGAPGFDQTFNGAPGSTSDAFVAKLQPNGLALAYGTFLGGTAGDRAHGIAVDGAGAAYVTGDTSSADFGFGGAPGFDQTPNGGPPSQPNADAFVVKLSAAGTGLVYGTYLGGSSGEVASGVAVDAAGAAHVVGSTGSANFGFGGAPGFDQSHNGITDGFVVKVAPSGLGLVYGTFIGGTSTDEGRAIALDSTGASYVAGETISSSFNFGGAPGFDQTFNGVPGPTSDAFVAKLNNTGQTLLYGTFLGGTGLDLANAVAVDAAGAAYVVGTTDSANFGFGGAPGWDQIIGSSSSDAFAVRLQPNGLALAYGTFIGGGGTDQGRAVAVDGAGTAYVTGAATAGIDFRGAPGFDQTPSGNGFLVRLAASGQTLLYGAFLDGTGNAASVGGAGAVYVAGQASSSAFNFGGAPGFDQTYNGNSDAFALRLALPGAVCNPRPRVVVSVVPNGDGRLRATISATGANNAIQSLRFTRTANAAIDLPNGQTGTGAFTYALPAPAASVQVLVRRASGGAATAELVVTDGCGTWQTLIGGGANAF